MKILSESQANEPTISIDKLTIDHVIVLKTRKKVVGMSIYLDRFTHDSQVYDYGINDCCVESCRNEKILAPRVHSDIKALARYWLDEYRDVYDIYVTERLKVREAITDAILKL